MACTGVPSTFTLYFSRIPSLYKATPQFSAACRLVQDALDQQDPDLVNKWTKAQKSYFEQARACANDMGMTITSRCRLVLPERKDKEENPFLKMMEQRRRA